VPRPLVVDQADLGRLEWPVTCKLAQQGLLETGDRRLRAAEIPGSLPALRSLVLADYPRANLPEGPDRGVEVEVTGARKPPATVGRDESFPAR
jgi:hypothetical protein